MTLERLQKDLADPNCSEDYKASILKNYPNLQPLEEPKEEVVEEKPKKSKAKKEE